MSPIASLKAGNPEHEAGNRRVVCACSAQSCNCSDKPTEAALKDGVCSTSGSICPTVNSAESNDASSPSPNALQESHAVETKTKLPKRTKLGNDIAYTTNHSIACLTTDFLMGTPQWGYLMNKWFNKKVEKEEPRGLHFWLAEMAGDLGAVPVTVALQYLMPGTMHSLGQGMEKMLGPIFMHGAERSARYWAKEHHVAVGSVEYKDKVEEIYRYEVDHLPQAAMWSVWAAGLNVVSQKWWLKDASDWGPLIGSKAIASSVTAGVLVALRSLAPRTAYKWDGITSKYVFTPLERITGITAEHEGKISDKTATPKAPTTRKAEIVPFERSRHSQNIMPRSAEFQWAVASAVSR